MQKQILAMDSDKICEDSTVVFRFKQVPFSMLKSKVFDLSKILCNEFKKRKEFANLLCR